MSQKLQVIQNQKDTRSSSKSWSQEGLRFECTECGKCCTGSPGYVWMSQKEINEIADYLKISVSLFMRRFVRQKEGRYSLIEKPSQNYDCVFLSGKRCTIYPVRPTQCRTFPWWPAHLKSQESWEEAAKSCEGINEKAPIVPYKQIEQQLKIYNEGQENP